MYTTEGSLGGYGGGDEESRISHYVHPPRFEPRVPVQVQGSGRGTVTSTKGSDQLGTFDFNALPAFRGVVPPTVTPAAQRKPRYRACDASTPPPLNDETSLTKSGQHGALRTWLVDIPKAVIRVTQGGCGAAEEVRRDVLSRNAGETSSQNCDFGGPYRDAPEIWGRQLKHAVARDDLGLNNFTFGAPPRSSHPHHTGLRSKRDGKGRHKTDQRRLEVPVEASAECPCVQEPADEDPEPRRNEGPVGGGCKVGGTRLRHPAHHRWHPHWRTRPL